MAGPHRHPVLVSVLNFVAFSFSLSLRAGPPATPDAYELHPALEMTLFAKEPDVVDPVGLAWDETGRLYVLEMRDYPYGFGPERKPGGTIRLLEDKNGDGKVDQSTVFARDLSFPTSIAPWNGGVIVTAPPEIIFLKDTNKDGEADVREVLFKGFELGVTDSNVNGLRWGLDNRLHGLNGGNGGSIISTRKRTSPVPIRGLDFSFDPASGDFTPTFHTSGGFGLVFDNWGRRFVTHNINHIQQQIIAVRYLRRFPGFPPIEALESISDHGEMARIFPVSTPETRVNHPEQSGHFSSAGGLGYIGTPIYPADLFGSILVCDVAGNLVHRDLIKLNGPVFIATRSASESTNEFFASRDAAFRPVGIEQGPDGALYLIDMQREVIEHPDYIPAKILEKQDIRAGDDRGRIYRITPKGGLPVRKQNLRDPKTWVAALADPNPWVRQTAQRIMIEKKAGISFSQLRKMAVGPNEFGRLHALWTLEGLGSLDEELLLRALRDAKSEIRENAVLLSERHLAISKKLRLRIIELARDENPRVRFQAALAIGQFEDPRTPKTFRELLARDHEHRWTRVAVLSSIKEGEEALLAGFLTDSNFTGSFSQSKIDLIRELSELVGARTASGRVKKMEMALRAVDQTGAGTRWQIAAIEGLQSGLTRNSSKIPVNDTISTLMEKIAQADSPPLFAASWKLSRALGLPESEIQRKALVLARERIGSANMPVEERINDIRVLALGTFTNVGPALLSLLAGQQPAEVQKAALEALRTFSEIEVAKGLIERWRGLAPAARPLVIHLLLQRTSFHEPLMSAIEQNRIPLGELNLDLEQRRRLMRKSSREIQERAAKFMGDEEYSNRKALVEEWLQTVPATGNATKGAAVFQKLCAQCHAMSGLGHVVGPDLDTLRHRSVEDLLSNILDPNMAINPNYATYTIETESGEIETGILQSESADAVVLLQAEAKKIVIPRAKIKRMESAGLSLMPEGLEIGLSAADLRDLISFIQQRP